MQTDTRRAWAQTLVGRTVGGRYRLDELLDVGGMGAVFAGRHLEVERSVAIKTLVPGALSDAQATRLRREARRAAAVGGRGVVDVIDFGVDEVSGPFLVMELLAGETLGARLRRRGALTPDEAFEIADAVLATLGRVHARGLVHRDLKPANLFLAREDDEEVVKILDFGIARPARETGETLTGPGAVVGTPRFMAPEQARGARAVDARADVYAMGAILYAMLSGRPPYDELDASEALVAVGAGPPRPLRELAPEIDAALAQVVEVAMRTAPEARYADADQMRAALRDALGAPSVLSGARPEPPRELAPAGALDALRPSSITLDEAERTRSVAPLDRGTARATEASAAEAERTRSATPVDRGAASAPDAPPDGRVAARALLLGAPPPREEPRRRRILGLALSLGVAGALAWAVSAWAPASPPRPEVPPLSRGSSAAAPISSAPDAPVAAPPEPPVVIVEEVSPPSDPPPEPAADRAAPRAPRGASDPRPAASKRPATEDHPESPGRTGALSMEDF